MIHGKVGKHLKFKCCLLVAAAIISCADAASSVCAAPSKTRCLAPAVSLDNRLLERVFDSRESANTAADQGNDAMRDAGSIARMLIASIAGKYAIDADIVQAVNMIRATVGGGAASRMEHVIREFREQAAGKNMPSDRIADVIFTLQKYLYEEGFVARSHFEREIAGYIETIIREHNSRLLPHEAQQRMARLVDIIESLEKYPGDSFRRPWARVVLEFESGTMRSYIFKQEVVGAMEEWGYHALKTLGIDASETTRYGNNLYLIVPLGTFNLGRVSAAQYLNPEFAERLSYLVGRAAVRSFVLGLADRKASNMRVILDESGIPHKVINADLASTFTLSKKAMERDAVRETVYLLGHIMQAAKEAGVGATERMSMINKFMEGFQMQLSEFQDSFPLIKERFDDYDITKHEKLTRRWEIAYQMNARKALILDRIDPGRTIHYEINALLLTEVLGSLLNNNYFRDDEFVSMVFKKNVFIYEKTENLMKMLRRGGIEFNGRTIALLHGLFDIYRNIARYLEKEQNFRHALLCYSRASAIADMLIRNVPAESLAFWQSQNEKNRQDEKKARAMGMTAGFSRKSSVSVGEQPHSYDRMIEAGI